MLRKYKEIAIMRLFSILVCFMLPWFTHANATPADKNVLTADSKLPALIQQMPRAKLKKMATLVEEIALTAEPQVKDLLIKLSSGDLYYVKSNKQVVYALKDENKMYQLTDVLTQQSLSPVKKKKIKKIRTNNRIRSQIKALLAQMDLSNPDKEIRSNAVKQILNKPTDLGTKTLVSLLPKEQDEDVKALMQTAIDVNTLINGDYQQKLSVISTLKDSLEPAVKNAMSQELESVAKSTAEDDLVLKNALQEALDKIEQKRDIFSIIESLFFGLSLGSVLLLAAIGLAITFGVMGVINMAHGEMMMLGAYTTYVIQLAFPNLIEYSLLMAIPAAFLVSGLVGVLIERGVIRFLKGRPLETLLATFGISLILQQLVRTIFSPLNRQVQAPEWMSGSWQINPIFSLTYNRLYIVIFSLMVFFALMLILKKSSLGLHVRAVAQNRDMARALSIKSDWVDAITFGLGSGIAGVAGVVLSQLTNVGPNLGQAYIIDSFLVVVFGGVGNLWGTLVAAMSLGSFNKFLEPLTGSVLANIIVLVGLVLFIQKRPKGLFPQKGRAE